MKTTHVLALALLPALLSWAQVPPPPAEDPGTEADADAPPPALVTNPPVIVTPGTNAPAVNPLTDPRAAARRAAEQAFSNRFTRSLTNRAFTPPPPGLATPTAAAPPASRVPLPLALPTPQIAPVPGQPATPGQLPPPAAPVFAAPAQPAPAADINANILNFKNAELDLIFQKYSELTGRTVLRPTAMPGTITIMTYTTELTREEAIQALEGALALNNVTLIPQGEKFVKAVPSATAVQEGSAISKTDPSKLPDSEQFVTHIVSLKIAKPSEVASVFQNSFTKVQGGLVPIDSSQILVIRDYASNVKRMLELIAKMDVVPETDYRLEVIPIRYGKVADLFDTMNSLVSGSAGGGMRSGASAQRRPGQAPTVGRSGTLGATSRTGRYGAGQQQNQPLTAQAGQLTQQAGQTGTGNTFQQRLNQAIRGAAGGDQIELLADARIVPDERSNSLIVFANKQDIQMITNIVAKVDVLLAQVLIEGIVLAVTIGDELDLGVSWLQNPKRFGNDFLGGGAVNNGQNFLSGVTNVASAFPSGFSYYGKIGDDINVALTALATDKKARVLQRPRIQTSHAVTGTFFTGSTVPYVTGFYNYGGYGSVGTQSQVEQIQVGSTISVTPYITPDGLVTMDVYQDLSQVEGFTLIDNNQVPTTSSRNAQATLSVRDGDTIMFGGYIQESKDDSKSGVPLLKDIPVLGALFRSKVVKYNRQELMLLLHVTILKTPNDAGLQARAEKYKLPGLYEAFKEFERNEEKMRQKVGLETNTPALHP